MTSIRRFGWTALALFALVGCTETVPTTPTTPTAPTTTTGVTKSPTETKALPVEPTKADAAKLSDEEIAELKKLPAEDQKIALAQMVCPVSGDHLGEASMGGTVKEVVDGKVCFLCCAGCEPKFKADPATYLAKLKK